MADQVGMMSEMQIDVFREICNIASSSAATSLSKIVGKRIDLSSPKVRILDFDDILQVVGGAEEQIIGIMQPMRGDIEGNIMFLLHLKEAHDLAAILINRMLDIQLPAKQVLGKFDEMEMSALREIGNILISSYLTAVSGMTGLKINPAVPALAMDMAGAIMSVLTIEFGKIGDKVLYIESKFTQDSVKVGGDFFLVPDVNSYGTLLQALGVG